MILAAPLRRTLLCLALWTSDGGASAAEPALVLERTIPLAGVSGRIDHMAVDLARRRLIVAELGNGTVEVVDLATGQAVHRIGGLHQPQGVGYLPQTGLIAVASAGDGSVRLFQGEDASPMGVIELGDDADNVRVDRQAGRLVVGYGSGGLATIDPVSRSVVSRASLPAHPEGFQLDPVTGHALVNVPDAGQVAVIDMRTGRQMARWGVPGLRGNFPMALDTIGATLATVFRNPARLILLNTSNGSTVANLEVCGDADDVAFDARRHRIYVSCGDGVVDVLSNEAGEAGGGYRRTDRIPTASGARTSLFVPELDRLFVAARAGFFGLGSGAAILVFRPHP